MENKAYNRASFNYVLVEKNEEGTPIDLKDVKILTSQEYIKVKDECAKNKIADETKKAKIKEEEEAKLAREKEEIELNKQRAEIEAQSREVLNRYKRRYSIKNFLIVYNLFSNLCIRGKSSLTTAELDSLYIDVVINNRSVEEAVSHYEEFKTVFDKASEVD